MMMDRWSRAFAVRGAGGKAVRAAWLMLDSPASFRLVVRQGFDIGVVDAQHGLLPAVTTEAMSSILDAGGQPFVRLAANEAPLVSKALDMGARGIIAPMINTADDAQALVAHSRFPPLGGRSFGPSYALPGEPRGPEEANDTVIVLAMIETATALENVEEIVSTDGIDGLFVGPMDLSLALGGSPDAGIGSSVSKQASTAAAADAPLEAAIKRVREAAHAKQKRVGIYCGSAEAARDRADQGFDLVTPFTDISNGLTTSSRSCLLNSFSGPSVASFPGMSS